MKAAILEKLNSPLVVDSIEPQRLQYGQVLVEVHKSGICGAQIGEIAGVRGPDRFLPHLMGHEGGGIVLEIGPGVKYVKPGDHVVMHWRKGVGIEADPPKYQRGDSLIGGGWVTTFNEMAVVSENRLTPIAEDIPFEIAALMGCAVTTGLGIINNEAHLKIGQSIAVIGCGGIGLNVIQGAAMVSANPIIAIDINNLKLQMAWEFGCTHTVNLTQEDISEKIEEIIGKNGSDVFVDTTGRPDLIAKAYRLTAPKGITIMVGQPHHSQYLIIPSIVNDFKGKMLMDSQGGLTNPTIDIPRYINLYRQKRLKLDNLITHRYPLGKINEAIKTIKDGKAGRVILELK